MRTRGRWFLSMLMTSDPFVLLISQLQRRSSDLLSGSSSGHGVQVDPADGPNAYRSESRSAHSQVELIIRGNRELFIRLFALIDPRWDRGRLADVDSLMEEPLMLCGWTWT